MNGPAICRLPWLPGPSEQDRADLTLIDGREGLQDIERLRRLSSRGWNESELRSIAKRLDASISALGPDWRSQLRAAGYSPFNLLVISSGTMSHLVDALRATGLRSGVVVDCRVVEYQVPEAWLEASGASLAQDEINATLLALDRTALQLECNAADADDAEHCIRAALERYERIIGEIERATSGVVIAQTLVPSAADAGWSMDSWLPGSPRRLVTEFNRRMVDAVRRKSQYVFDAAAIAELVGISAWDSGRFSFIAKLPFDPTCVPLYSERLVRLIASMVGRSKRVLVLDLDNTLWGGVIGDDGLEGIVLGQGSARGEAHLAIQRMALVYKERGVVLCAASKNTEEIALDAFRRHSDMLLKEEDFALLEINWRDKATNIRAMAETLDLGLDTFVFVDDNPVERKQVRDMLPSVAVPELPQDPAEWVPVIQAAAYFEQVSFSAEDRSRTEFYKANARRRARAKAVGDSRKFLESLEMVLTVKPFDAVGRARIAQLISKSNQFNLTTRRYSEAEVAAIENSPEHLALQCRLEDVFGDNGMISVVICKKLSAYWEIDTWIMSCRVIGRGVEEAVLAVLADHARRAGVPELRGTYIPTPRNGLVRDHYQKLGFRKTDERDGTTTWCLNLSEFSAEPVPMTTRDLTQDCEAALAGT